MIEAGAAPDTVALVGLCERVAIGRADPATLLAGFARGAGAQSVVVAARDSASAQVEPLADWHGDAVAPLAAMALIDWSESATGRLVPADAASGDIGRHWSGPPFQAWRCVSGVAYRAGGVTVGLALARAGRDEFESWPLRSLEPVLAELGKACLLHWRMARAEAEATALAGLLDLLDEAVLLVDSNGRPVRANRAAEYLLQQADGIAMINGRLSLAEAGETRTLHHLLSGAEGALDARARGGRMMVSRPSGRMALSLAVVPLRSGCASGGGVAAALILRDPAPAAQTAGAELADHYRLTRSELRLATIMGAGTPLVEAAARLGISHNTARTHLKRIYAKIGIRRKADLVRLIGSSGPCFESFEPSRAQLLRKARQAPGNVSPIPVRVTLLGDDSPAIRGEASVVGERPA